MSAAEPRKSTFREYFETIVVSVIIVLFTKTFVFQHFKIPTGSMIKTLLIGDHLMVNRYIYRKESIGWLSRIMPARDVRRGDVVVFKYPDEPNKDFIKRVIGIPGDRVELRHDQIYINGARQEEPYRWLDPDVMGRMMDARMVNAGPYVVPEGRYFMMGDNRYNSQDSRFWRTTFARTDEIKGRAMFIWWSWGGREYNPDHPPPMAERAKGLVETIVQIPTKTRWSRCFRLVR